MPVSKPRKRKPGHRRTTRSNTARTSRTARAHNDPLARSATSFPGPPADRRALERDVRNAAREFLAHEGVEGVERERNATLEEAQELVYDAWETDGQERIDLAWEALDISMDCADAWVILAEEARSPGPTLEAFVLGMRAGERALGPRAFEKDVGQFWGILETRGYMRAREGVAQCLASLGEKEAALAHLRELLRLNPNDNQGNRYFVLALLLSMGRDDEAEELLERSAYADDSSCEWSFGRALLRFRNEGDSPGARAALAEARDRNARVIPLLLGAIPEREDIPPYIEVGGETEAIFYAEQRADPWNETPGALDWLRAIAT